MSLYKKRYSTYIICGLISLILLIIGAYISYTPIWSSILIGIGCSGITASAITLFIEIRNNNELSRSRAIYFKTLYDSLIMLLQRILWFDERLSDNTFDWNRPLREYSTLSYMLFSHQAYPTSKLTWDEFRDRIKQCREKYDLDRIKTYSEKQQTTITRLFAIINASSSHLNGLVLKTRMSDVVLASQDYISLDDLDTMCYNITLSIELMGKPQKNYGVAILMLMTEAEKLRNKCKYNDSDFCIALQGLIQPSEL